MVRLTLIILASVLSLTVFAGQNPFSSNQEDCDSGNGNMRCPPGYKLFKRATQDRKERGWCMKYFTGNYTFFEAEAQCRCQGGGTLSGIENMNEQKWVKEQAKQSFEELGIQNGGVWVGAYRRKDCFGDPAKFMKKKECAKEYQFQWTDRNTIGIEMWKHWMEGSPHNNKIGTHTEACVIMQVSREAVGTVNGKLSGTFDNRICVAWPNDNSTFIQEGFICGRPPKGGNTGYYGGGGGQIVIIGEGKPVPKKTA